MFQRLQRGAEIIINKWLKVAPKEKLLIIVGEQFQTEESLLFKYAKEARAEVEIMTFGNHKQQASYYFDKNETALDSYDVILGATAYSFVTTKAVKRAIERGSRFLSLPLLTNHGQSLLESDFFLMDPNESKEMGDCLLKQLVGAKELRVTTKAGTNLTFSMEQRQAQLFTGDTKIGTGYASSSFEVFIPVVEDKTYGVGVVDASLGYLGVPKEPIRIYLKDGKITEIEQNESGQILSEYIKSFGDNNMYIAGEFGIGLNKYSKCRGNSYIEDESAYQTFHIGFGRNIAFGGMLEAKGHFDLVFYRPDIYADNVLIIKDGEIIHEDSLNNEEVI